MADLKILSTHAIQDVLHELGPAFEHASGASLTIDYDPANALKRRIDEGEAFDIAIVTRPAIDALSTQGKIRRETCTDIGRSGLGVAARKGGPPVDVSTVDAFRKALLAAGSVARSKEGTSGSYFETLLTRLGIAEAMRGKIVLGGSGRIAELVVRGQADLAVQQIPELLPVTGADFAGPLPDELQLYTVFSAGVAAACKAGDVAVAFIDSLTTPAAAAVFKAKGLESVPR
ncbi:MAG TPA: substrate-binding domain-containing protein [Pseudolabrys sp.]|nr:substrate-binding domain-containing protein [Pseudolabrys sp.]